MVKHLLLILFSVTAIASKSGQVDASSNNIPISFDDANAGSKLLECGAAKHIIVHNESDSRIAWGLGLTGTEPSTDHGYVVANTTIAKDGVSVSQGSFIYVRSDSGAPISSGIVSVECW